MVDTLLIYVNPYNAHSGWELVNEQGRLIGNLNQGNLSDIGGLAKGRRATVLIDSACVNIENLDIPGQNKQRQKQAVPFALEEQLADDIDDMHFALGTKTADDNIPVASINKTLLDNILEQLTQAGVFADVMSADVIALPYAKKHWSILIDEQRVLIKTDHSNGYYCDRDNLSVILPSLLAEDASVEGVHYFHKHNDEDAATLLANIDQNIKLITKTYQTHPLEIFSQDLTDVRQLNILQGDYTAKRKSNLAFKPWKSVAVLLFAWMLVDMTSAVIASKQLEEKNQALTSAIEKEFKRAIPNARKFNNMRKRMEQKLKQLQNGGNESDPLFLHILANATESFNQNKKVNVSGIVFRNTYVDMDLQADSLESLEKIKKDLSANKKLKVVMSTSVEKNKTRGRLRLETQG